MIFFINTRTNEIHRLHCEQLLSTNRFYLGVHECLESAVVAAIDEGYTNARCCSYCCTSIKWQQSLYVKDKFKGFTEAFIYNLDFNFILR